MHCWGRHHFYQNHHHPTGRLVRLHQPARGCLHHHRDQPPSVFDNGSAGFYDGLDTVGTIAGTTTGTSPAKNQLAVTLGGGAQGVEYNFGENPPGSAFGFVYLDQNRNGTRDLLEPGIPNVTITISGTVFAGTELAHTLTANDVPSHSLTALTDPNGRWEFPILPPGVYSLVETQPIAYGDGQEENAEASSPTPVTVGGDRFDDVALQPFPARGPFNFGEVAGSRRQRLRGLQQRRCARAGRTGHCRGDGDSVGGHSERGPAQAKHDDGCGRKLPIH